MRNAVLTIAASLAAIHLASPDTAQAQKRRWSCDSEPVQTFWEAEITGQALGGRANVCLTRESTRFLGRVDGLTVGNAYTLWWVYIDDASACDPTFLVPGPETPIPAPEPQFYAGNCSIIDFFGEKPLAVFGRMDGGVPQKNEPQYFSGVLNDFKPAPGSQVWAFIFGHGPADEMDNARRARQLLTPEDPTAGVPHLGNNVDGPGGYPAGVIVFEY